MVNEVRLTHAMQSVCPKASCAAPVCECHGSRALVRNVLIADDHYKRYIQDDKPSPWPSVFLSAVIITLFGIVIVLGKMAMEVSHLR
jgi:hypothetical protein